MYKFYIVMSLLLILAIINLVRAIKEKKSNSRIWGITINVIGIVLIGQAIVLELLQ